MSLPYDHIVFFDGYCNLCNGSVDFLINRDMQHKLHYASLQSEIALAEIPEDFRTEDSMIFYSKGVFYLRSDALIEIGRVLGGIYKVGVLFKFLPSGFRDWCYRKIAKNRYRWFGKRDTCRVPTPKEKSMFLG